MGAAANVLKIFQRHEVSGELRRYGPRFFTSTSGE